PDPCLFLPFPMDCQRLTHLRRGRISHSYRRRLCRLVMSKPVSIEARRARMADLIVRLAPSEGYTLSAVDGVAFMRSNRPLVRTPALYEPSIVIVAQGRKRGFHGGQTYVYDAQHYLALAVP